MLWMTSAAELFHSRRYRFGHRHNAGDISVTDSSPTDATSSSSSSHQHRTPIRRHSHHYSNLNNRREYRHDLDACEPSSRRIHRRRLDHSEHESAHSEQVHNNQSPSGSIINSDDFRSIQRRRATGNDRLPGSVLLARERLLERLRGVSVSGNRQTHQDEASSFSGNNSFIGSDTNRGDWVEEMASESWQTINLTRMRPPGLGQNELNCLSLMVFSNDGERNTDEMLRECTICLEGFKDGEKLIRLNCTHVFHSGCLFPWVRVCGACPNCRKAIVVNVVA